MKCIICHGNQIKTKKVKEEYIVGNNIILIPVKVPVCETCGERYFDRKTMQFLEKTREKLSCDKLILKEIGKVMAVAQRHSDSKLNQILFLQDNLSVSLPAQEKS